MYLYIHITHIYISDFVYTITVIDLVSTINEHVRKYEHTIKYLKHVFLGLEGGISAGDT
jgi:hypothetical protein